MTDSLPAALVKRVAMSYAWGVVCFDTWDYCLEHVAALIFWDKWPQNAKMALFAVYPAYFAFSSGKRISGPDGTKGAGKAERYVMAMVLAMLLAAYKGYSAGRLER